MYSAGVIGLTTNNVYPAVGLNPLALQALGDAAAKFPNNDLTNGDQLNTGGFRFNAPANSYVDQNAYIRVITESGGAGFNAGTAPDYTTYFYSLPSNRMELWFLMQSEWFRRPVFREFYKERDVVREERRMRVESDIQGKLQEALQATAFMASPYRNMIGWASEIEELRATCFATP